MHPENNEPKIVRVLGGMVWEIADDAPYSIDTYEFLHTEPLRMW